MNCWRKTQLTMALSLLSVASYATTPDIWYDTAGCFAGEYHYTITTRYVSPYQRDMYFLEKDKNILKPHPWSAVPPVKFQDESTWNVGRGSWFWYEGWGCNGQADPCIAQTFTPATRPPETACDDEAE